MPRRMLHFATLIAVILLTLPARMSSQAAPPQERSGSVNGITISDVPGEPFSATVVLEFQRYWPDGSTEVRRTINLIARDSQGRTHNEIRRLMPEYFHGSPELISVHLFDPVTNIRTVCDPALHIARQQLLSNSPGAPAFPNPFIHQDDLGKSTLNGLQAKGTRRTYTVSAMTSGTGKPVQVEEEDWYSDDLHINLLARHSDPRTGVQTIGVSNLKREEPPASMFQVPKDYKIIDVALQETGTPAIP